VFYGAAVTEALATREQEVYVVGSANSAGQAAMHLSKYASRVTLVVRRDSLSTSMSEYLIREIEATENVKVCLNSRVVDGGGEGRLEHLAIEDSDSGTTETVGAAALFVLKGARPHTGWLSDEVARDEGGFVLTGQDLAQDGLSRPGPPSVRPCCWRRACGVSLPRVA
jgi:thioredoxin reductase (NADPH)